VAQLVGDGAAVLVVEGAPGGGLLAVVAACPFAEGYARLRADSLIDQKVNYKAVEKKDGTFSLAFVFICA